MSRWLALAEIPQEKSKPVPDSLTIPDKTQPEGEKEGFCPLLSGCQVGVEEEPHQSVSVEKQPDQAISRDEFRHGHTFDGTPKTWTGKVISLVAWRHLSEWGKHGPDGKQWNGKTQRWELSE